MTAHSASNARLDGWIRRMTITSLALTLLALLIALQFVYHTTGGTVFLFSAVAPLLVISAVAIYLWITIFEFRRAHKLFSIEHFPPNTVIFRQGDPGDSAYFIRKGEVEVIDEDSRATVNTLSAGDYFGEIALVTDRPRTATVRTVTEVEAAVLGKENFLNMMHLLPSTEDEILTTIQKRVMVDGG